MRGGLLLWVKAREAVVRMVSWQEELARWQAEARQRFEDLGQQLVEVESLLEAEEEWLSQLGDHREDDAEGSG